MFIPREFAFQITLPSLRLTDDSVAVLKCRSSAVTAARQYVLVFDRSTFLLGVEVRHARFTNRINIKAEIKEFLVIQNIPAVKN